jgi:L-alanine-DL-glutamate epimerase-like enolase superfamily enzyme
MKITDLKCAVIGGFPVVRITTDAGIDGIGQAENWKPNLKPHILYYREMILGLDPTNVEAVMQRIRRMGSFKPWGAAVSAIEIALWDIAGKAANLPIYKLLGGKVRDKVRVYNGAIRFPLRDQSPEAYAEDVLKMAASPEGFSLIKQGIAFHSRMPNDIPGYYTGDPRAWGRHPHRGMLSAAGFRHTVACVEAMRNALPAHIELALDCGPGFLPPDAVRLAQAVEGMGIAWLEDMLTGDYVPYVSAAQYRDVKAKTSTPIHTGEQIYLRQNFKTLIDGHAVDVIGPDPCDVGGIAELKWIAEYADLYGISIAPHGTANGIFGLASLIQVCATLPDNLIAFEYPARFEPFWYDITEGFAGMPVKNGLIDVYDRPGLGVNLIPAKAKKYLSEGDSDFFD